MSNSCLFCGADGAGAPSNEHVIPQWLLRHLEIPQDDQLFQGVTNSKTETPSQAPRIHSTFSFVQGHVCKDCNSGWMSRLEESAMPVLVPLIDQTRGIDSLSPAEAEIVGKWAVKTCYVHSLTSPLKQPVPLKHIRMVNGDDGKVSPGVTVFGMQSDFKKQSAYFLTRHWPLLSTSKVDVSEDAADSYKIGLQFRHLYLLTACWPNPKSIFAVAKGLHLPVFSLDQRHLPTYSIEATVGDGPVDQLALFRKSLAVCILSSE